VMAFLMGLEPCLQLLAIQVLCLGRRPAGLPRLQLVTKLQRALVRPSPAAG
jgi:hypothetical protein